MYEICKRALTWFKWDSSILKIHTDSCQPIRLNLIYLVNIGNDKRICMGKSCWVASLPYKSSYNISKFQLLLLVLEFPMLQTSNLAVFLYIPLYVAACASRMLLRHRNRRVTATLSKCFHYSSIRVQR